MIIKIVQFLFVFELVAASCDFSTHENSDAQFLKPISFELVETLSIEELDKLFGITIATRGEKKEPVKLEVVYEGEEYMLPISRNGLSFEYASNFDIFSFARANDVDSLNSIDFVESYSSDIVRIFEKTGAYEIISHPEFGGEFIIFRMDRKIELIYLKDIAAISNYELRTFFEDKSNKITEKWYLREVSTDRK